MIVWSEPTQNSDGTRIGEATRITGYRIHCGPNAEGPLPLVAEAGPDVLAFEVLPEELLYCAVRAGNVQGVWSQYGREIVVRPVD